MPIELIAMHGCQNRDDYSLIIFLDKAFSSLLYFVCILRVEQYGCHNTFPRYSRHSAKEWFTTHRRSSLRESVVEQTTKPA